MFDAICVSERTRKPWTVLVSFAGQVAMIGLAVLVPLMSTEGLPHHLWLVTVPEPPRGITHHEPPPAAKPVKTVPFLMKMDGLHAPAGIPDRIAIIHDEPVALPPAGVYAGVQGGIGDPSGPVNRVIDSVVRSIPPPAPAVAVAKPGPAPPPIQRIKVGGKVQEGKLISGPRPVYPPLARAARIEGSVRLAAVIARDGTVMDLRAVSGHPMLVPAALAAVQRWIFRPTTLNGDAVEVATDIEVNFVLQR